MDPEILFSDNLVENKHHKLTRSRRQGHSDKDLKPNPAIRSGRHAVSRGKCLTRVRAGALAATSCAC